MDIAAIASWLTTHLALLGTTGAAIAFLWSVYQFFHVRSLEAATREFDAYHKLVKELVEPDEKTGVLYLDRQAAIVFELRHFVRYYEFSLRMLKGLLKKWEVTLKAESPKGDRLIEEMKLTIAHIEKKL